MLLNLVVGVIGITAYVVWLGMALMPRFTSPADSAAAWGVLQAVCFFAGVANNVYWTTVFPVFYVRFGGAPTPPLPHPSP